MSEPREGGPACVEEAVRVLGSLPLAAFGRSAGNDTVSPPARLAPGTHQRVTPGEARVSEPREGGPASVEEAVRVLGSLPLAAFGRSAGNDRRS